LNSSAAIKIVVDDQYVKEIARQQIDAILSDSSIGTWWDMKRLENETCRKRDWLIEKILLNPKYRTEMIIITNMCEGGRWIFKATEMRKFLDENFHDLNKRRV